ncbi:hypothetical protein KY285_000845 [Solanum tuberosum]|nr:hypothetical protein KY289_001028 [Solanum tuberosum]KAH0764974.1 hypothetical protein KY285_000845 [Solanum tuberosum]
MRKEISNFSQLESETEGLSLASRRILNNAMGGPIMKKTPKEAIEIEGTLLMNVNKGHLQKKRLMLLETLTKGTIKKQTILMQWGKGILDSHRAHQMVV